MRELFFKQTLTKAIIGLVVGVILSFCSFVYISFYIYTDGYDVTVPAIILIIGLILQVWGAYKIKMLGKATDAINDQD